MNGLIVLVPYSSGQEFYSDVDVEWGELPEEDDDIESDEVEELIAYLPVYVETEDEALGLMAVAYAACVNYRYVACPSNWQTDQEWQERGYPGTLEAPGVDLPNTEEAFEIPEPGDCFCCGSLSDYEVITPQQMVEQLKQNPQQFVMTFLDDDESLWQQFDDWSVRILNYPLLTKK
jgi:hypothetical protein